jgi:hypothetical protein
MTASISETRKTFIQIFNETRRKIGVSEISTLSQDTLGTVMIDYMNDILAEIDDYGDWQEMYKEESFPFVTANSSAFDYTFNTSAVVKNIHEVQFGTQIAPMWLVDLDTINRLNRTKAYGVPTQWGVVGVDNVTTGNPVVRVFPTPVTAQASANFHVKYYKKPALITSADTSSIPAFPSRMVSQGLLAYTLRDEERGAESQQWLQEYQIFQNMIRDTFNRFNGDTGSNTYFIPPRGRRGR